MEIDMLPDHFLKRMEQMLGKEYQEFLASYGRPAYRALRFNCLKADESVLLASVPFSLKPVPWADSGYYYADTDTPGKHPYHEAGVYYMQEPSAMAPVEYLMQDDGIIKMADERILDLCAAPGGKSTQIAAKMKGEGILISNEIHPVRAKQLSGNIERMGIRNAMVTNESPRKLSKTFKNFFTRILVDAPCSGEGMFRKNETAVKEWSPDNVALCAKRQDEILDCAALMLRAGGRIVYSTCTFAPEENEGAVSRFLVCHPEFKIAEAKKTAGMQGGVADWIKDPAENLEWTVRLWPHSIHGEGHYFAILQKEGGCGVSDEIGQEGTGSRIKAGQATEDIAEWEAFAQENIKILPKGRYQKFGDQVYLEPYGMPFVTNLKVLRQGLHLGTIKKKRFEPSHALALAMNPKDVVHTADFTGSSKEIYTYLKGQTLNYDGEKGWYLITVDGYGIGWGKLSAGMMKNHYPKGLRILY